MTISASWLQLLRDLSAVVQSVITIVAIFAGGLWFLRRRQRFPRANVSQTFTHWYAKDVAVLHAVIRVANVGDVVLRLRECSIRVLHLLPPTDDVMSVIPKVSRPDATAEFSWPLVAERTLNWKGVEREIEPGETDEILVDIVVPVRCCAVQVSTYIRNLSKSKDIGWIATSICDLRPATALGGPPTVEVVVPVGSDATKRGVKARERKR